VVPVVVVSSVTVVVSVVGVVPVVISSVDVGLVVVPTYDVTTTDETLTTEGPSHEDSTNDQKIGSKMSRQKVCYQRHFSLSYV
jgi:hypothetical protein